jgi:hypothetical protein
LAKVRDAIMGRVSAFVPEHCGKRARASIRSDADSGSGAGSADRRSAAARPSAVALPWVRQRTAMRQVARPRPRPRNRNDPAIHAPPVDRLVVVPLVHDGRLDRETRALGGVDQRQRERSLGVPRRLPVRASGRPVIAQKAAWTLCLRRRHPSECSRRSDGPTRVGVGELLALGSVLGQEPLTVGVSREIRPVDSHVAAHLGQALVQRGDTRSGQSASASESPRTSTPTSQWRASANGGSTPRGQFRRTR